MHPIPWSTHPTMQHLFTPDGEAALAAVLRLRPLVALDFDGSQAQATYLLVPEAGGTRVTWAFDSTHGLNPFRRWLGLLFDRMIGADYEKGLGKLKSLLEGTQA